MCSMRSHLRSISEYFNWHAVICKLSSCFDQGTSDEVVDFSHGKKLWELSKEKYEPLWLKGGGHCNLELHPEFLKHLKKFLATVNKRKATESSLNSSNEESKQAIISDQVPAPLGNPEISRKSLDNHIGNQKNVEQPEKSRMSADQPEKYKRRGL